MLVINLITISTKIHWDSTEQYHISLLIRTFFTAENFAIMNDCLLFCSLSTVFIFIQRFCQMQDTKTSIIIDIINIPYHEYIIIIFISTFISISIFIFDFKVLVSLV